MTTDARRATWDKLRGPWDVIVVGGGITGAGVLREAARAGLKALLVEQKDFAWGTSSRSSKLVHGGLRYLKQADFRLTWESVREREELLRTGPGLVEPMKFLLPVYREDRPGMFILGVGMAIYDTLAGSWRHERYDGDAMHGLAPIMRREGLVGGYRYHDATTDDARLVLRVLREAVAAGGTVVSYAEAVRLERGGGVVTGLHLRDTEGELPDVMCPARAVINATGAFADALRGEVGAPPRMRPLRGSHLVFSLSRFPVKDAIAMQHPVDRRAMFVYPWEGVAIVGTTDLDHDERLADEPAITAAEAAYLMTAIERRFPSLGLSMADVVGTWSGVRPVVSTGKKDPSKETREHAIWDERGLITVTGGKLTTFRLIARDALTVLRARIGKDFRVAPGPVLDRSLVDLDGAVPDDVAQRLVGRHGNAARELVEAAGEGELEGIGSAPFLWAEVRWAARHEWVIHLDDLLLRRARIGLLLPNGAAAALPRVRTICQAELGWTDARWDDEQRRYLDLWSRCYAPPDRARVDAASRDASARVAAGAASRS